MRQGGKDAGCLGKCRDIPPPPQALLLLWQDEGREEMAFHMVREVKDVPGSPSEACALGNHLGCIYGCTNPTSRLLLFFLGMIWHLPTRFYSLVNSVDIVTNSISAGRRPRKGNNMQTSLSPSHGMNCATV